MKNHNIVEVKLQKEHINEHLWLSNSEDILPEELTIVFDQSRLAPARQYLDSDPFIKGVLLPADMLANEDADIEVEDEQIWIMRGKELRAEFTDGLTGTVYSIPFSFEYKKRVRVDNRLLISASVRELLQIQNKLLTPLAESPFPEWPEYAERGYCYMIDFEAVFPIPENLPEEQKSSWCLENWGGNMGETLINCIITADGLLSLNDRDFLDIYFETEAVPLPAIRRLIAEYPKLEVEYSYCDQLAQCAGQITSYGNNQYKEDHFTDNKNGEISRLEHQFGYEK